MTPQKFALAAATTALCLLAAPTLAQSQGDWTIGIGIGNVNPKSNNGTLAGGAATINDDTQLTLTAEYFFWDNIGIELLAASPFKHDVSINGAYAGTIKHLPPTLSVNYHFPTNGMIKPFAGIGLNYTTFFDETSPLGVLSLKDSFGVAVQLGADFAVSDQGAVRVNVRWMDIDSDVSLNGAPIGPAEIDPIVLGIAYVHRF